MTTIHKFLGTGDAYDACQCDESIKTGDVLLIEEERVVGVAGCWPVAVTVERGELHHVKEGVPVARAMTNGEGAEHAPMIYAGVEAAIALARSLGYDLQEEG